MKSINLAVVILSCTAFALPLPQALTKSLLSIRQNSGSTSTSTTSPGLVNLGLISGSAAAAEDGNSTSSTSTSECNLLDCSSGSSAAGPGGSDAASSSTSLLGLLKL